MALSISNQPHKRVLLNEKLEEKYLIFLLVVRNSDKYLACHLPN